MSESGQLILSFEHRPSLGGEDFLVAAANADAVAWLDRWPDWPSPMLAIHGPAGCGKTHLCRVFMARCGAVATSAQDLMTREPPDLLAAAPALAIDDVDAALEKGAEESLLHLYNTAAEMGRRVLLTARRPPAAWGVGLADLRSRLATAVSVGIAPPDDALIAAVVMKLFADRQLKIDKDVPAFMLARMERTFDAARRLVGAIDEAALREKRKVTVPFVSAVMSRLGRDGRRQALPPDGHA